MDSDTFHQLWLTGSLDIVKEAAMNPDQAHQSTAFHYLCGISGRIILHVGLESESNFQGV